MKYSHVLKSTGIAGVATAALLGAQTMAVAADANYVLNTDDTQGIDHVFAYEDQAALLAFLEHRLEMRITLEQKNVSPSRPLSLTEDLRAAVEAHCARDFIAWRMARG